MGGEREKKGRLMSRSSNPPWFYKNFVPKHFTKFTRKHLCPCLFLNKFLHCGRTTLLKETPVQVFPNEFCKVYQNNFFREQVHVTSSTV